MSKRELTKAELEKCLSMIDADRKAERLKCIEEGLKDEMCEKCGVAFLADQHFIRCDVDRAECPMMGADSKSMLDMLLPDCVPDEVGANDGT